MRIITWNMHRAGRGSAAWNYLERTSPDIALLQEVVEIPDGMKRHFQTVQRKSVRKNGSHQNFYTAILVKGRVLEVTPLVSDSRWIKAELQFFSGNFICCKVETPNNRKYTVVTVHSPAWPLDQVWKFRKTPPPLADFTKIQLKGNAHVWPTEILWSALIKMVNDTENWIIGGDYNISETFDTAWQKANNVRFGIRSCGNKEILDRMRNLEFVECLRAKHGKIVPTYINNRDKHIYHQMDHLFVPKRMYATLQNCATGNQKDIFEANLSDHLPIIADFT